MNSEAKQFNLFGIMEAHTWLKWMQTRNLAYFAMLTVILIVVVVFTVIIFDIIQQKHSNEIILTHTFEIKNQKKTKNFFKMLSKSVNIIDALKLKIWLWTL